MRVDLHLHTSASFDCKVSPEQVASRCHDLGLAPIFLTDHDTMSGALQLQSGGRFAVIAGEEVMTKDGELIGLFLKEVVPPGLSALETATRIKSQAGLVYLEHPYDLDRRPLSEETIESLSDMIDIVEVFNGRSDTAVNPRAQDLCETLGAAAGAGSDAHTLDAIGSVYTELDDFSGPQDFLVKLRAARIVIGKRRAVLRLESAVRRRAARK